LIGSSTQIGEATSSNLKSSTPSIANLKMPVSSTIDITLPPNDMSIVRVLDLIQKRLAWIGEPKLRVGKLNWKSNDRWDLELIRPDLRPVYCVSVDIRVGRFFWTEVITPSSQQGDVLAENTSSGAMQ